MAIRRGHREARSDVAILRSHREARSAVAISLNRLFFFSTIVSPLHHEDNDGDQQSIDDQGFDQHQPEDEQEAD